MVSLSVGLGALIVYLIKRNIISMFLSNNDPLADDIFLETENFLNYAISTLPFFGLFFVGMSVGRGSGHT